MNEWHGAPPWRYAAARKTWLEELSYSNIARRAEFVRRRLELRRHARTRVTVVRLMAKGERRYDDDNLRAGCKPILDALRKVGVLQNDSKRWTDFEADQRPAMPGEPAPATWITVELIAPSVEDNGPVWR